MTYLGNTAVAVFAIGKSLENLDIRLLDDHPFPLDTSLVKYEDHIPQRLSIGDQVANDISVHWTDDTVLLEDLLQTSVKHHSLHAFQPTISRAESVRSLTALYTTPISSSSIRAKS